MPDLISRRLFLASGAALAASELQAIPWNGRPSGSLIPIDLPAKMAIPPGAFRRLGGSHSRITGQIRGFRVHPNGSFAVLATREDIWYWDLKRASATGRFKMPADIDPAYGRVTDSETLVIYGKSTKQIENSFNEYKIPGGELISRSIPERIENYDEMAISNDGKLVLVSLSGEVRLLDFRSAKVLWRNSIGNAAIVGLNFAPGQSWVSAATKDTIKLLRLDDGKEIATLFAGDQTKPKAPVENEENQRARMRAEEVHISTKGDWIAGIFGNENDDRRLVVWNLQSRKERFKLPILGKVIHVANNGNTILVRDSRHVKTLEMTAGKVVRTISIPNSGDVCLFGDGKIIVNASGDTLNCIDAITGDDAPMNANPPSFPEALAFHGENKLFGTLNTWGGWVEWNLKTGQSTLHRPKSAIGFKPINVSPDGKHFLYWFDDHYVRFSESGSKISKTKKHKARQESEPRNFAADDRGDVIVYVDELNHLIRHDFSKDTSSTLRETFEDPQNIGLSVSWRQFLALNLYSPRGETQIIEVWDISLNVRIKTIKLTHLPRSMALGPNGTMLSMLTDIPRTGAPPKDQQPTRTMRIFSVESGKEIISSDFQADSELTQFSPCGRLMAFQHDNTLEIWDLYGGGIRHKFECADIQAMAFSPNGKILATAVSGAPVFLWNLYESKETRNSLPISVLDASWNMLSSKVCSEAFDAIRIMATFPAVSMPYLREKLPPALGPDMAKLKKLFDDLDHKEFRRRELASRDLAKMGSTIRLYAKDELVKPKSPEHQERLERLLAMDQSQLPISLQAVRAVEIAELSGSIEGDALLKRWSEGFRGDKLTMEAIAALDRRKVSIAENNVQIPK